MISILSAGIVDLATISWKSVQCGGGGGGVENSILKIRCLKIPQWAWREQKSKVVQRWRGTLLLSHTPSQAGKHWWQPQEVAVVELDSHEQRQRKPMQSQTRLLISTVAPARCREQVAQVRISWPAQK